jgi:heme a synthase
MTWVFVVLYLGTVVTGAGPHAGHLQPTDLEGDRVHLVRNGLDPQVVSHVHAGAVYLLVALTLVTLLAAHRTGAPAAVRHAALTLLLVEIGQAAVGFTQYFSDLPVLLVGVHLLGAALLTAAAAWLLVSTRGALPAASTGLPSPAAGGKSTERTVTSRPGGVSGQRSSGSIATARNSSAR